MTNLPRGYIKCPGVPREESTCATTLPEGMPYKKSRELKHDEHNRRPPRPAGNRRVCQCCYRGGFSIHDFVCKRCLNDRHELALLEREIAVKYPATAKMTSAQIFRRVWERSLKLQVQNAKLKAEAKGGRG